MIYGDEDWARSITVTQAEAKREIAKHDGEGWTQFLIDCGDKANYPGSVVLDWLGY